MKDSRIGCLSLFLLTFLATVQQAVAQIPCSPTILPKATLFVNWPQFRYDAQHTGCNSYETILSTATVGGLVLDWTYATTSPVYGDPAVANGLLYFTSNNYPDAGLYALNATTGALVWSSTAGQGTRTPAAVANGLVYIGREQPNGGVYAFNAATGDLVWQYPSSTGASEATVVNGVVYAGVSTGVVALTASTGQVLWSYGIDGAVQAPAVANGVLYFNSIKFIYPNTYINILWALDATTRQVLWQQSWTNQSAIINPPVVGNGAVYFNSTAFNANTGAVLWNSPAYFDSLPALADGKLYVGSVGGVYALSASTGTVLWSFATGDYTSASPAVANGVVYIESQDGNFYALNATTGALLWKYKISSIWASGAVVANGIVYVGSQDNNLYTFHLPGH